MEKSSRTFGVEEGGSKSATPFHPSRTEDLHAPLPLTPNEFLRRLIGERTREVAVAYWPLPEGADKKWPGERIEAHYKQATNNLHRMLLEHHDRPPTIKLLFVAARVLGPETGVAIAHFFADQFGTERGAEKFSKKRVQDDLTTVKHGVERGLELFSDLQRIVEKIATDVSRRDS